MSQAEITRSLALRVAALEKAMQRKDRYIANLEQRLGRLHVSVSGRFHFTNGTPSSSLGTDGDGALDYSAGVFYEKESGAWVQRYTDAT